MKGEKPLFEFRSVPGQHNPMVICSVCQRDASQTRMSYYCVDVVNRSPARCDECRLGASGGKG